MILKDDLLLEALKVFLSRREAGKPGAYVGL